MTVAEFCDHFVGHTLQHVNLNVRGLRLSPRVADRPWEPGRVPVEAVTSKRRRLFVDGFSPAFMADPARRAACHALLTGWPEGWTSDLHTSGEPPEWMVESGLVVADPTSPALAFEQPAASRRGLGD